MQGLLGDVLHHKVLEHCFNTWNCCVYDANISIHLKKCNNIFRKKVYQPKKNATLVLKECNTGLTCYTF